jgi:hypothetical protein
VHPRRHRELQIRTLDSLDPSYRVAGRNRDTRGGNSSSAAERWLAAKTGATSGRLEAERQCNLDRGTDADAALDVDRAAESFDSVTQPDKAGAACRIGATDSVVQIESWRLLSRAR